ncbi:cell envelope integrity TolA C-terminal domain-containing protein [Limnobaculum xujianqingii]|uniref:cell envelope integrity TolA C-terminal domain-containing protein n=1 Tax=Limnobaculum xujianqingii TaxID=2738837 RepID=UPI0015BEADE3|nr:cell envelope integrity TolA C-terminal domain-containing protein [Limnobaculum xujianqingii]
MKRILLLIPLLYCSYSYGEPEPFSVESIEGFEQNMPTEPQQPEETKPKASYEEMTTYRTAIHDSVMRNFAKSEEYKGKQCEIRLHFDEDGKLHYEGKSLRMFNGDGTLCSAAFKAITTAKLPKPQNSDIHNEFKIIFFYFHSNDFVMKNFSEYEE